MDVQPLLTLGDAIESFLNDNDPYTAAQLHAFDSGFEQGPLSK